MGTCKFRPGREAHEAFVIGRSPPRAASDDRVEPLEKVRIGETDGPANPNSVRDNYDDPRLDHA
jgi:hypothetical protein